MIKTMTRPFFEVAKDNKLYIKVEKNYPKEMLENSLNFKQLQQKKIKRSIQKDHVDLIAEKVCQINFPLKSQTIFMGQYQMSLFLVFRNKPLFCEKHTKKIYYFSIWRSNS